MSISQIEFLKIERKLGLTPSSVDYTKIRNAVEVLNVAFLKIATRELQYVLSQPNNANRNNLFERLMNFYNDRVREHQAMFLLMHIIETALRSKAASVVSKKFSTSVSVDDWWYDLRNIDKNLIEPVTLGIKEAHRISTTPQDLTTFDLFDSITFNQLLNVYDNFWTEFKNSFVTKSYKKHQLPAITEKQFKSKMMHIRKARNDIAHHKPINHSHGRKRKDLIEDIELILCHLGFNLDDAVNNIDPKQTIISLKYI